MLRIQRKKKTSILNFWKEANLVCLIEIVEPYDADYFGYVRNTNRDGATILLRQGNPTIV